MKCSCDKKKVLFVVAIVYWLMYKYQVNALGRNVIIDMKLWILKLFPQITVIETVQKHSIC
jgi:hypothetical protein